jgi:hypothetical protein
VFPTAAVAACAITGNSTIQLATPRWALAGSTPIGSPIIGAVSQLATPRWALALGAAAYLRGSCHRALARLDPGRSQDEPAPNPCPRSYGNPSH